jgi:putative ABC transport system permease protein
MSMETFWQDLRYAARVLTKKPGFTTVVVLTLALGIGANTAIFSLIYGILLRPFPYREPGRLVRIQTVRTETGNAQGASVLDLDDWRRQADVMGEIGIHITYDTTLSHDGPAQSVQLTFISPQVFTLLGVSPVIGRTFTPDEDRIGGDVNKAVLSYDLWQTTFGSDRDVVGRVIRLRGDSYTVVGVMPPGFRYPEKCDVWVPIQARYASYRNEFWKARDYRVHSVIARLKEDVTLAAAQAGMNAIASRLELDFPTTNQGVQLRLVPLRNTEVGNIRPYLLLLGGAVMLVLLICCVNVANLMLARSAAREREMAIRVALGSGRWRIARQLLTESLLLGLLGGVAGLLLAWFGLAALLRLIPVTLPFWMKIEVDAPVLIFNLVVAVVTGVVFGLVPAWQMSRTDLSLALKEGAKGTAGAGRRLRDGLVVAEFALSLVLLIGAGLMMQSFVRLLNADAGATEEEMVKAYSDNFYRVKERLATIPGVVEVGGSYDIPYYNQPEERPKELIAIRGQSEREQQQNAPVMGVDVMPDYFKAMGIPLLAGRDFNESDDLKARRVVIVSQHTAETLWPGREPLGQQMRFGKDAPYNPWCTVIGVVADTRWQMAEKDKGFEAYFSYRQFMPPRMHMVMRVEVEPESLIPAVRVAVHETNPDIAITQIKSMNRIVSEALWQRRLWGVLFAVFAGIALALAAVGIYGVMSYLVNQRTREIGIRMALGAPPQNVSAQVVKDGMKLAFVGLGIGYAVALALTRVIATLLFGVNAADPITFIAVSGLLLAVALVACYFPARRAARVDPIVALRCE